MQTRRDLFRLFGAGMAAPALASFATPRETSGIAIHRRGRPEAGPIWLARSTDAQMLANTFSGELARALGREPDVYDAMSLGMPPSAPREVPLGMVWECFVGWSRHAGGAVHVHRGTYIMESYRWVSLDMLANAAEEMGRLLAPARRFYRLGLPGDALAANS